MTTNFEFLKKIDKNLYTIISEAELLYRDEYFEQCMVQTRRFGEHVCKNVLGSSRHGEKTFDDMLATLKDKIKTPEEKEFIEDLYFLKKHGNNSAHSVKVHKDGIEALECLQRAFEAAINYCVYSKNASNSILNLRYDTELLVTGKKSKKTLAEKYIEEKSKTSKKPAAQKKSKSQSGKVKSQKAKTGISLFGLLVIITTIISVLLITILFILLKI